MLKPCDVVAITTIREEKISQGHESDLFSAVASGCLDTIGSTAQK